MFYCTCKIADAFFDWIRTGMLVSPSGKETR
jgi:hypothetical protein